MLSVTKCLRPLAARLAASSSVEPLMGAARPAAPLSRTFATSFKLCEKDNASASASATSEPSHASTDETFKQDYPPLSEVADIGHSTTGPGVGKHTQRTLASFSTTGKVCVVTGAARGLGNMFVFRLLFLIERLNSCACLSTQVCENVCRVWCTSTFSHAVTYAHAVNAVQRHRIDGLGRQAGARSRQRPRRMVCLARPSEAARDRGHRCGLQRCQ